VFASSVRYTGYYPHVFIGTTIYVKEDATEVLFFKPNGGERFPTTIY